MMPMKVHGRNSNGIGDSRQCNRWSRAIGPCCANVRTSALSVLRCWDGRHSGVLQSDPEFSEEMGDLRWSGPAS